MNETLHAIAGRRSIRRFKPEQIPDTELDEILTAALLAPNARNQQMWHFTVIQNADLLERMVAITKKNALKYGSDFIVERASDPSYHTFHRAPTVVMISADDEAQLVHLDCGAAAENITIAAESLGIGSCVIASSAFLFATDEGNELRGELLIPDGYSHVCSVALGYKAEDPPTPERIAGVISYVR